MRQRLTTGVGFAAIVLALAGVAWVTLAYSRLPDAPAGAGPLLLLERILSLSAKTTLFLTGVMLIRRSRLVWPVIVFTLLLSMSHSALIYGFFLPPVPDSLSSAAHAGRIAGRVAGLMVPPLLYLALMCYLSLPRTRDELRPHV